jgi:hypothetical protein
MTTTPTLTFLFFGRNGGNTDVKRHDIRATLPLPTDWRSLCVKDLNADVLPTTIYMDVFKAYAIALEGEDRVTDDNFADIVERNITTSHPIMVVVYDGVLLFGDMLRNYSGYDDTPAVAKLKFESIADVVKQHIPDLKLLGP